MSSETSRSARSSSLEATAAPGPRRTDRNGLEILDEQRCIELIAGLRPAVGRLGFVVDGHPKILPVNYVWHDGVIVMRSSSGSKLDAAYETSVVAFEVDDVDARWHGGWSVLVEGRIAAVEDSAQAEQLAQLPLQSWAPERPSRFVQIVPSRITGRRL